MKRSWNGSDDDYMLLMSEEVEEKAAADLMIQVNGALASLPNFGEPSAKGPFARPVAVRKLTENIGLGPDTNDNTTQRMLLLLESIPVWGEDAYDMASPATTRIFLGDT